MLKALEIDQVDAGGSKSLRDMIEILDFYYFCLYPYVYTLMFIVINHATQ